MHAGRDLTEWGNIGSMTPGSDECIEKSLSLIVGRTDQKKFQFMIGFTGEKNHGIKMDRLHWFCHWPGTGVQIQSLMTVGSKIKTIKSPPPSPVPSPVTPSPKLTLKAQCESFSSIRNLGNEMTCRSFQCWTLGLSTWKYKTWKIPSLCSLLRESERVATFRGEKPTQGWSLDI